jgi:hypothetical protein
MDPAFEPDKGPASRIQKALNGSKRGVADGCGLQNENKIRGIAATATTARLSHFITSRPIPVLPAFSPSYS